MLKNTPLAPIGKRILAFFVDMLIVVFLIILCKIPFALQKALAENSHKVTIDIKPLHAISDFLIFFVYFGFATYFGHGQTFGKRLFRLRVVPLYKDSLSLWQCLERGLGYAASALEGGFGFIQAFWYPNRQTVHDRIAETVVIQINKQKKKIKQ